MIKYGFIFLYLISNSAFAEWTYVTKNQSGTSFYIDLSTIEKVGNKKKFWVMVDLANPYKDVILSFKRQMELDCPEKTVKGLFVIGFSRNLTKGQILMNGKVDSDPTPISPSSMESDFFDLLCKSN